MLNRIFSLISGVIFGLGLTVSSMINPTKVISFLDITGKWDPSLMFVMIGAIVFCFPIFYVLQNKNKPFFASKFERPTKKNIDGKLLFGSSIFGLGWGMIGLCPGPAISSLALFHYQSIIFVLSMAGGFYVLKFIKLTS